MWETDRISLCKQSVVSFSNERGHLFTSVRFWHTNPGWKGDHFVWTFIRASALMATHTNLTNLYHLQRSLRRRSILRCLLKQVHQVKRHVLYLKVNVWICWDSGIRKDEWQFPDFFLQTGGMKAGTFDSYPTYSAEPYVSRKTKSAMTNKEGKIFNPSPGPKSTPVKSIINLNVNRYTKLSHP